MECLLLLQCRLLTMGQMHGPLLDQQPSISAVRSRLTPRRFLTFTGPKLSIRQS